MLSGIRQIIEINISDTELLDSLIQSSGYGSRMSLNLQPNESHNFLAIIFCFYAYYPGVRYRVKNITSGFVWSDIFHPHSGSYRSIVIVPSSSLSIRDGDDRIEITSNIELY